MSYGTTYRESTNSFPTTFETGERFATGMGDGVVIQTSDTYIKVEEQADGTLITATDATGTTTAKVRNGKDGERGKDGIQGRDGQDGKSAYEIAVEHGFEGTEEEWLESFQAGVNFIPGHALELDEETGTLSVIVADEAEADNTLPITSAAVHTQIGNIDALLQTI